MLEHEIYNACRVFRAGNSPSDQAEIQTALETKIPKMLRFLGDEDDDVSGGVVDFASEYITMLKTKGPPLTSTHREHVKVSLWHRDGDLL